MVRQYFLHFRNVLLNLCNNSDQNMILSFINICKVTREGLKPRASPSVFNTSLGTLQILMNGKSCLIPLLMHRKPCHTLLTAMY